MIAPLHEPSPPLVSVVIPTYNCEAYIADTIASVLAQTHAALEVIVVDDGSTDRTAEIVEAIKGPVRLIRQPNQRVCVARNRGFEASRGEFVCFLDHDDYWYPWKLRRQLEAFAAYPQAGAIFTSFALWQPKDGAFPSPSSLAPPDDGPPPIDQRFSGWIYHEFLLDCWALTSTTMIRREAFARSGGFDPALSYSEDWDLWLRLAQTHEFVKLDRVSTLYRQHGDQGNLKLRMLDYRTLLLENAVRRWGLASRDGRRVEARVFHRKVSSYHLQFALHHMRHGSASVARSSLMKAWRHEPTRIKCGLLVVAATLGWRPKGR